jgi:hypothetical protein
MKERTKKIVLWSIWTILLIMLILWFEFPIAIFTGVSVNALSDYQTNYSSITNNETCNAHPALCSAKAGYLISLMQVKDEDNDTKGIIVSSTLLPIALEQAWVVGFMQGILICLVYIFYKHIKVKFNERQNQNNN